MKMASVGEKSEAQVTKFIIKIGFSLMPFRTWPLQFAAMKVITCTRYYTQQVRTLRRYRCVTIVRLNHYRKTNLSLRGGVES